MYLLYLDESGNENGPADRFFVLGGIALFERQIYFLAKAIDAVQEKYFPDHPPITFHASEIRSGREFWRKVPAQMRHRILTDLCDAIASALLQAADLVSHATWLLFERRDPTYMRALLPCFDQGDGVIRGLTHVRVNTAEPCDCPACYKGDAQKDPGPWFAATELGRSP
ncbi:MAG: DUF3800 domain-containing protein [Gammaproteobacteria bacterium]